MPYANNQNVRIHYRAIGNGFPLVLYHGLAGCLEDWADFGYMAALEDEFQLIGIDAAHHREGRPYRVGRPPELESLEPHQAEHEHERRDEDRQPDAEFE